MEQKFFKVSSITYAQRGQSLLRNAGMNAYIERVMNIDQREGCGYVVYVKGDTARAEQILRGAGIQILGVAHSRDQL